MHSRKEDSFGRAEKKGGERPKREKEVKKKKPMTGSLMRVESGASRTSGGGPGERGGDGVTSQHQRLNSQGRRPSRFSGEAISMKGGGGHSGTESKEGKGKGKGEPGS